MNNESLVIYIVAVLCLGAVLILTKDRLDPKWRRVLALISVILIALAFVFVIVAFLAG
ncbi:hypothetical protein KIH86_11540 [Paenibacillus sp. HN-1]|uniref:hypothetical protein n=1 Tax=Paenibacillus TaxID=44249 RepID=UPI001CA8A460|nr:MULTISPECIES: hypothetical protein [Paenibacillus]MBY9082494.1 hypothetical protein [Paenibacillus sp. CGMCC 1.18879]MBY9084853.1 hypothetical protein [Paenibacillus sinensis]